jgi:hypothetical protein
MINKEKIRFDQVAVKYRTDIKGWVGPDGRYYGDDERLARWANCDLVTCSMDGCVNSVNKTYTVCDACLEKSDIDKWKVAEKRKPMPEDRYFYSDYLDKYYGDLEEAQDEAEEVGVSIADLRLYHCQRARSPEIDLHDLVADLTPDGMEPWELLTDEIILAAENLNRLLAEHKFDSFSPTKIAVDLGAP